MKNQKKLFVLMIASLGSISSLYTSTINPDGTVSGPGILYKDLPHPKVIGGQGGIYHGPAKSSYTGFGGVKEAGVFPKSPTLPLFKSLEIRGAQGQTGAFYPILRVAFLQDKAGNVTYFTNVTPTAPDAEIASLFVPHFATALVNGKTIPLFAIAVTPEVTTKIKEHYHKLMSMIPVALNNMSALKNQTLGELYEMALESFKSWITQPVSVA